MKTVDDVVTTVLKNALEDTKKGLYKDFCNATDARKQEESRLMSNILGKLTFNINKHIKKGN